MHSDAWKNEGKFSVIGKDLSVLKTQQPDEPIIYNFIREICTENVECHSSQILLPLKI